MTGNCRVAHLVDGAEDRAVAAENDGHVGLNPREVFGAVEVGDDDFRFLLDLRPQALGLGQDVRALSRAEEDDPQGAV